VRAEVGRAPAGGGELLGQQPLGDLRTADQERRRAAPPGEQHRTGHSNPLIRMATSAGGASAGTATTVGASVGLPPRQYSRQGRRKPGRAGSSPRIRWRRRPSRGGGVVPRPGRRGRRCVQAPGGAAVATGCRFGAGAEAVESVQGVGVAIKVSTLRSRITRSGRSTPAARCSRRWVRRASMAMNARNAATCCARSAVWAGGMSSDGAISST